MFKKYLGLWIYLAFAAVLFGFVFAFQLFFPPGPPEPGVLPPCATEDSDNCYWDGGENGKGNAFVVIDGKVFYLLSKGE